MLYWIGGVLCTLMYNKGQSLILKILWRKTFPQAIKYFDSWHKDNDTYLLRLKEQMYDIMEWIIL